MKGDTQWVIETYGRTASGQRKRMHEETSEQTVRLALPGGWFVVTALNGGVRTKHTIEVTPGTTYTYDIVKKKVTQSSQACGDTSQVTKTC